MWNIDTVLFTEWKYRDEKQLKIIFINRYDCVHHKTTFQDFTLLLTYQFGFDSKNEKHVFQIKTLSSQNKKSAFPSLESSVSLQAE